MKLVLHSIIANRNEGVVVRLLAADDQEPPHTCGMLYLGADDWLALVALFQGHPVGPTTTIGEDRVLAELESYGQPQGL